MSVLIDSIDLAYDVNCEVIDEGDLTCTSTQILPVKPLYRSKVSFTFPKDDEDPPTFDDLSTCVHSTLFSELQVYSEKLTAFRKTMTIYHLKFNLNDLTKYTKPLVTDSVTIFADTVYMEEPLEIFYNLTIRARIVAITHPITLTYDKNFYNLPREMLERHVSFEDKLVMRQRRFGLIDIMDQHDYVPENEEDFCHKSTYSLSNDLDLHDWFDSNIVNMIHICSHSMLANERDAPTAKKIIDFVLNFYQKSTDVKDASKYIAAQRFLKFKQKDPKVIIHYVPKFGLPTIKELSETIYKHLTLYWTSVRDHQTQVKKLSTDIKNSNQQFELAEMQMMNMFHSEKATILNSIKQANVTMLTSFEHR